MWGSLHGSEVAASRSTGESALDRLGYSPVECRFPLDRERDSQPDKILQELQPPTTGVLVIRAEEAVQLTDLVDLPCSIVLHVQSYFPVDRRHGGPMARPDEPDMVLGAGDGRLTLCRVRQKGVVEAAASGVHALAMPMLGVSYNWNFIKEYTEEAAECSRTCIHGRLLESRSAIGGTSSFLHSFILVSKKIR